MKPFKRVRTFIVILSFFLFFCGAGLFHFDTVRSKTPEIIDAGNFDWNVRGIAYAAPEEKIPAGDYGANKGVRNDQSDDSRIQNAGFVTLVRILSVIAMSIFLVWYIRRKLRL